MRDDDVRDETRVRARDEGDLAACVAVLGAVHRADGYPTVWPDDPAAWLGPGTDGRAWVAEREGRIVGHVALVGPAADDVAPTLLRRGPAAVVSRLFVDPGARGLRVGARLLARAAEAAHTRGARTVLDVVTTDTAAIALYERLGWTFLGAGRQQWSSGTSVTVRCYAAPAASRSLPRKTP
ncbi:GNAT family N-acetyltransferase [Streptomyces sp. NPDC001904]|uniref:GNAT family N-acetyltransferase n=1 Tax=Streptomyces sp. NPDC001904 TaxID=3154531 RepID=UPI00332F1726